MYSKAFFAKNKSGSLRSAKKVIPILLKCLDITSVVDVGCGSGTWLSIFQKNGVENILGIDGKWVNKNILLVENKRFIHKDLSKPFNINRKFDLAISLEVAEHLPLQSANHFVTSITKLSKVIVFSAAIPRQDGDKHLNEQWQEYWADKFKEHNYKPIDFIRPLIWNDSEIEWWYRQNLIVYVHKSQFNKYRELSSNSPILNLVHPDNYLIKSTSRTQRFKAFIKKLLI